MGNKINWPRHKAKARRRKDNPNATTDVDQRKFEKQRGRFLQQFLTGANHEPNHSRTR